MNKNNEPATLGTLIGLGFAGMLLLFYIIGKNQNHSTNYTPAPTNNIQGYDESESDAIRKAWNDSVVNYQDRKAMGLE